MEEQKKYEIQGTVTISTEEYRDLIYDKVNAEKEKNDYMHRYWDEQNKSSELKDIIAAKDKSIAFYRDFVNSSEEICKAYKEFYMNKQDDEI